MVLLWDGRSCLFCTFEKKWLRWVPPALHSVPRGRSEPQKGRAAFTAPACLCSLLLYSVLVPFLMQLCPPLAQSSEMPFEELLALYGYEASDPISEQDSESNDITPNLPDMTLDKVRAALRLVVCALGCLLSRSRFQWGLADAGEGAAKFWWSMELKEFRGDWRKDNCF